MGFLMLKESLLTSEKMKMNLQVDGLLLAIVLCKVDPEIFVRVSLV